MKSWIRLQEETLLLSAILEAERFNDESDLWKACAYAIFNAALSSFKTVFRLYLDFLTSNPSKNWI